MSINKLQASLAQATNEVTVAAANINFDFCLINFEAPKEYRPLGERLSSKRKQDAEYGESHITARRLAALFDGVCSNTPKLIRAYGERASEISRQAIDQESKSYSASLFGAYAGVDATSIWAAATSAGDKMPSAIHVHLLACMLASIFDAAEATSIWVELVEERRKTIAASWERGENMPFSMAAAAVQQGIPRTELAKWDSSARAWLQTADSVMTKKQTQLRLILHNVSLSMGPVTTVYLSVIETWNKTLTTIERLVSGVPQEVHDGSAILGLAAWHIYPDIIVFGSRSVEVFMNDPLVAPGGLLSLGCSPSATTPISGVSWSLSLAKLKHYGKPTSTRGTFKPDPTRITFKELLLASLGCILSQWNVHLGNTETLEAVKFIIALSQSIIRDNSRAQRSPELPRNIESRAEGLRLLGQAAEQYLADKDNSVRFLNLGRNRPQFLPPRTYLSGSVHTNLRPFFGLGKIDVLLQCVRDADGRVEVLRRMAARSRGLEKLPCVIQYVDTAISDVDIINYATVFHQDSDGTNSSREPVAKKQKGHARWIHQHMARERVGKEILYPNGNYSVYAPSPAPRLICTHRSGLEKDQEYKFWYGDWDVAAIYILSDLQRNYLPTPKLNPQDLLWCLEHDLLSCQALLHQVNDSVMQTLEFLAAANWDAFGTITGPVIRVQTLERPLIDADCVMNLRMAYQSPEAQQKTPTYPRIISTLSYLVAGHDIPYSKIPANIIGMSIGDSIFVPEKLLDDPMIGVRRNSFTRILGNIGKPGFTMFFSVENPITATQDTTFWRVADPQKFDGTAVNMFYDTSMHLSFTNWERPIEGFSPRGNQDIQLNLMESVISIRERGKWIGDVDLITALKSHVIYHLPPQGSCDHSVTESPDVHMTSIESWAELREFHAGNAVVRASGNWLARLATTAYLAQCAEKRQGRVERVTICPPKVCWRCLEEYIKQFPANIYIY
ncbi:hypothetical protein F4679DRAFT_581981 [Xylaria curta]|nr:hypothetical protein F4679DRAFT_581981 [Xylaria curta]